MSLFTKFIQAVQSWRRHRGAVKSRTGARVGLEQLDHRQLLAVNFTGVVANDFPATQVPGVVTIVDTGQLGVAHPLIPPDLQQVVKVSGFDINGISTSYDPTTDTLSIGISQPLNQKPSVNGSQFPVIAGDADNNGNSATVDPLIVNPNSPPGAPGLRQNNFADPANLGGSETMGAILNFTGSIPNPSNPGNTFFPADIVAGFRGGSVADVNKNYEVAQPLFPGVPTGIPQFGTELPQFEGTFSLVNDPTKGALEFSITHFSELYTQETGQALTSSSVIRIGAFGSSTQDDGISEATFPPQPFTLAQASPPPVVPPVMCPPVSPPVLINPHSGRHVNTAHAESVRVSILGTSGFDPTQIDPATVRLGGATPFTNFARNVNHDDFIDETFVFRGYDISLPAGITPATVTGQLYDGTKFATTQLIFNRNDSFYTPAQIAARDAKIGFQPPEELALEMASLNANGDPTVITANILQANALAAAAAETIPSNYLTFAPVSSVVPTTGMSTPASNAATNPYVSPGLMAPAAQTVSTPTPSVVSIPRRAAHKGGKAIPAPKGAAAFRRAAAAQAQAAASTQSAQMNAQDAAIGSFSS